jgi:hypothetical protein
MNIGYACINMTMGKSVTTNRSMVKKTFQSKGLDYVSELALKNAKDIMNYNCVQSSTDAGYLKRYADLESSSTYSTPYITPSFVDKNRPSAYEPSDLKELYLTREQLQARMVAPEITQDDFLKMKK